MEKDDGNDDSSSYEQLRLQNIMKNREMLAQLGLNSGIVCVY